jgi:hypothetical protein
MPGALPVHSPALTPVPIYILSMSQYFVPGVSQIPGNVT